jgi:mRNA-degrading endonuclease RelE of RelBE toxin-antitoxin system
MGHNRGNMTRQAPYTFDYARGATEHLKFISVKYRRLIRESIAEQLQFEPNIKTKNRKPLRQPAPFNAAWEIRLGPNNRFRVLYDIDEKRRVVQILAIGEKEGNRLFVGGEEFTL